MPAFGAARRAKRPAMPGLLLKIPMAVAASALFALMALTFADVVLRSAFSAPIEAATELTRILMAVIVFSALPETTWRGGHIVVDLMDGPFSRARLSALRDFAVDALCGGLLLFPARRVAALAERARDYGDATEYLHIPVFYVSWFVAVSAFATAGILLARAAASLRRALAESHAR